MALPEDSPISQTGAHAKEETLEDYSLGRLTEPALSELEDHLLLCEYCQERLDSEDRIRQGVRVAAPALESHHPARPRWNLPRLAWGFGFVLILAVLVAARWSFYHPATPLSAVVVLQATRGSDRQPAAAPARKPIILVLDLTDLQALSGYTLEIVDPSGRSVYRAGAVPQQNKLQVPLPKGLPAGAYFVRVYTPAQELLREYALVARG